MPIIEITLPAPTLDHQTDTFDAIEELILLGKEHAFVKKDGQILGIVCLDSLLGKYSSADVSETKVANFAEPLTFISEYEHKSKVVSLMQEKNLEHIAVTNQTGDCMGIAALKH